MGSLILDHIPRILKTDNSLNRLLDRRLHYLSLHHHPSCRLNYHHLLYLLRLLYW